MKIYKGMPNVILIVLILGVLIMYAGLFDLFFEDDLQGIMKSFTLENLLKIIQMGFYIVGSIVAIKSYLSAKRGLLNTVNTEYQKKVILKLEELSNKLFSEFDPDSEQYWAKEDRKETPIMKYIDEYIKNNKEGIGPGAITPNRERFLSSLLKEVKSDPFLPENISTYIVEHLENRRNKIRKIYIEEGRKFVRELNSGMYKKINDEDSWNTLAAVKSNEINRQLYENDCGISQVEDQVHIIRIKIRDYLRSYDPFNKKPWYKKGD